MLEQKKQHKVFAITLLISLLLHVIILLILFSGFMFPSKRPITEDTRKIRVKLQKPKPKPVTPPLSPPQQKTEEPQFFELVDNPNANEQNPDKSGLLSDKSSSSSAPETSISDRLAHSTDQQKQSGSHQSEAQKNEHLFASRETPKFSRISPSGIFTKEKLGKTPKPETGKEQKEESVGTTNPSNSSNSVFDPSSIGEIALSTYAWEYAPYMKSWLRNLQRHWVAPPAYSELGLIHGYTIVRFRIYPDGRMEGLEVLYQMGHQALQQSSVNAVEASFPFKPLPDDFPDPFLEITLKMIYPNLRQYVR